MRSAGGGQPGNAKLRGKLRCSLSCGCCDLVNPKWKERVNEADREIREVRGNITVSKQIESSDYESPGPS
jgi:hypothetical protein